MTETLKKGILFSLITAAISGISIFYNKLVIVKGIDPLVFNIIKNGGVALILSGLMLSKSKKQLSGLIQDKKTLSKLALIGLIGGSIPFMLYFEGLRQVSAINANLIHKSMFIFVAMMALPFLGEKLNIWQIAGYFLVVFSNFLIGGFSGFKLSGGEGLILLATLFWAVENIIAKITLKKAESLTVAWGRMFFGALILILVAVFKGKISLLTNLQMEQAIPVFTSIILLALYVVSWYQAMKLAPVTLVSSVLILATPLTNLLSAVFITHRFPGELISQSLLSLFGIVLITVFIEKFSKKTAKNQV